MYIYTVPLSLRLHDEMAQRRYGIYTGTNIYTVSSGRGGEGEEEGGRLRWGIVGNKAESKVR